MITVVGEILVDLIEQEPGGPVAYPGGSPANVAVALARLGRTASLLTQLGDDPYGRLLRAHLRGNGVTLATGSVLDSPHTSVARTSLAADGQAEYSFDISWQRLPAAASAWLDPTSSCVHTGSLGAALAPGADDVLAMVLAARQTRMISYDPNCRPSLMNDRDTTRDRVVLLAANSDIVKVSRDDLAWLYPGRHHRDVARDWLEHGAGLVVVTLGGDGAWAATRQRDVALGAWPTEVVDTIGAGDAFTAGLLSGLDEAGLLTASRRADLRAVDEATLTGVLAFASQVAALTCGRRGADSPTLAELATSQRPPQLASGPGVCMPPWSFVR